MHAMRSTTHQIFALDSFLFQPKLVAWESIWLPPTVSSFLMHLGIPRMMCRVFFVFIGNCLILAKCLTSSDHMYNF